MYDLSGSGIRPPSPLTKLYSLTMYVSCFRQYNLISHSTGLNDISMRVQLCFLWRPTTTFATDQVILVSYLFFIKLQLISFTC